MTHTKSARIEWRPEYAIGVSDIDLQHQRLLFMLNKMNVLIHDGEVHRPRLVMALLDDFNDYATYHFRGEEMLMRVHLDAGEEVSEHMSAHHAYWKNIPALTARYKEGDKTAIFELASYLNAWWVNHILVTDQKMGRALNSKGIS